MARWILRLLSIATALALASLLIYSYERHLTSYGFEPRTSVDGDLGLNDCFDSSPTVYVALHGLDVQEDTIQANLTLCLPTNYLRSLEANDLLNTPIYISRRHSLRLDPRYKHLAFQATIGAKTYSVPLSRLHISTGGATYHIGSTHLLAYGSSEDFPLDAYQIEGGAIAVQPPPGVFAGRGNAANLDLGGATPIAENDLANYTVRAPAETEQGVFQVVITRNPSTIIFALIVTFVPVLLACALAFVIALKRSRPAASELLLAGGAIILAILPIRAVLVPDGVAGLTLVDKALAWEIGVLLVIVVWGVTLGEAGRDGSVTARGGASRAQCVGAPQQGTSFVEGGDAPRPTEQ